MTTDIRDYEKKWPGLPIKYLILSTNDFIVFLDNEIDLDWKTTDNFDRRNLSESDNKQLSVISNEIACLESIPVEGLSEKTIINFKRQLGEALIRGFYNDYDNGIKMLKSAKEYITDRNADKSRFLYLKSSAIITSIAASLGIISWIFRTQFITITGETAFYIGLSFFIGALGAFLSIILRLGKTNIDYHASEKLHFMEGASKIVAGMISALLISSCIKAGILLPVFNKVESTHIAMLIGGLIAGSSERLAPSIIKKIDGSIKTKN